MVPEIAEECVSLCDLTTSHSVHDEEGIASFHIPLSIYVFRISFLWIMNEDSALLSHMEGSDPERQKDK